jgi:hypothetical protein
MTHTHHIAKAMLLIFTASFSLSGCDSGPDCKWSAPEDKDNYAKYLAPKIEATPTTCFVNGDHLENNLSGDYKSVTGAHKAHLESKGYVVTTATIPEAFAENEKLTSIQDKTFVPIYLNEVTAQVLRVYEKGAGDALTYKATMWFDLLGSDGAKMKVYLKN